MKDFLKSVKGKITVVSAAAVVVAAAIFIIILLNGETGYRSISISEVFGSVMTENEGKIYEAYRNMHLAGGYVLTTDSDSYSRMILDDDKYMKLEQLSKAIFEDLGTDQRRRTAIRLENGALVTEIASPLSEDEDFIVNTPNAVLAVRGTFFRVEVKYDENGILYTDVYTYGGKVVCKRVLPNGTVLDEEVEIKAGYKARIKMDDIITVYIEEIGEESGEITGDDVDPINVHEIYDRDLVDIYNASYNGHEMFLSTKELWLEIKTRDINIRQYRSVYDGGDIPPYDEDEDDENGVGSNHPDEPGSAETENTSSLPPVETTPEDSENQEMDSPVGSQYTESPPPPVTEQDRNSGSGNSRGESVNDSPAAGTEAESNISDKPSDTPQQSESTEKEDLPSEEPSDDSESENDETDSEDKPESGSVGQIPGGSTESDTDSTDDEEDEEDDIDTEAVLYLDDGSITITSTGYSQNGGAEIPYTGDYTIAQQSASAVTASIAVQSGTHNITLDGVSFTELAVSAGASVTLAGTANIASSSGSGISNGGTLNVSSGTYIVSGSAAPALSNSGTFRMSGGSFEASGSGSDIGGSGSFVVTGGSLKATSLGAGTAITNAHGDPLVCETFTSLPSSAALTFRCYDGASYTYALTAADVSSDGKYYVWKPAFDGTIKLDDGSVTITSTGFTQNGNTINYTGPLTITQDSSSALNASITVDDGTHDITLDGVNISSTFKISNGAAVNLYGSTKPNTIAPASGSALTISGGTLVVKSGTFDFTASGTSNGVYFPSGGAFTADGGTVSITGGGYGVLCYAADIDVTGGNVRIYGGTQVGLYSTGPINVTAGTLYAYSPSNHGIYNNGQSSGAKLTVSGGTVTGESDGSNGIHISGGAVISGGTVNAIGATNGFYINGANGTTVTITKGSVEASGGTKDVSSTGTIIVTGGSFKLANNTKTGSIVNAAGDTLECYTVTSYPGDITSAGYTYYLDVNDKAADGNYYVWLPSGTVIP